MVKTHEYSEGTLNEVWENFELKEDETTDRLVLQLKDAARTDVTVQAYTLSFIG